MKQSYIAPELRLPELSFKVVFLGVILAAVLAASNTYLALKVGLLTSASIPAAMLSMGILRFFKGSNILENNLVQTCASAGEAVAGGIVYTIPAMVIIGYWTHFRFFENFFIALIGGLLGVLFCIPIRRVLMDQPQLNYPEGKAIAEVLIAGEDHGVRLKEMLLGGAFGAFVELCQSGLKIIASQIELWFSKSSIIFGFGAGFSATLIGAGYLVGFEIGLSLLIGAGIGWFLGVPVFTFFSPVHITGPKAEIASLIWNQHLRYIGVGAMLLAGVGTLFSLVKPLMASLRLSMKGLFDGGNFYEIERTDRDIPYAYVIIAIALLTLATYFLFEWVMPFSGLGFDQTIRIPFLLSCLAYVILVGFIFSALAGYFSGLVGVSATPGSAILIACVLFAAIVLHLLLGYSANADRSSVLMSASGIIIVMGSVIMGSAAIANDNIQDLKVGHLVGATPWKQELMLMVGVLVAAIVIPFVMQLLFDVYGIAGVGSRPGMDLRQMLPAPPAAMMAGVVQSVFDHQVPWNMFLVGAVIALVSFFIVRIFARRGVHLSVLAVALGIYLPLASSVPLFIGGLMARLTGRKLLTLLHQDQARLNRQRQKGVLLACGLVSGAALMDVFLAVPAALSHLAEPLRLLPSGMEWLADGLGVLSLTMLCYFIYYRCCRIEARSSHN